MSPEKRKLAAQEGRPRELPSEEQLKEKPYTLEEFSYEYFRYPTYTPLSGPSPLSPVLYSLPVGEATGRLICGQGPALCPLVHLGGF